LVAYRKAGRLGEDVIWYKARMNLGNVERENSCEMEPNENVDRWYL
jgi:hypothetical protein